MEITQLHNRMIARHSPAAGLSVLAYDAEQRLYYHADGCLGYVLQCSPLIGVDERIVQQLQPLLAQNYPTNSLLQISLWTNPDIEDRLIVMEAIRGRDRGEPMSEGRRIATSLVRSRIDFLREHTRTPVSPVLPTRVRDIQCFVAAKIPCRGAMPNESEIEHAANLRTSTEQILRTLGMHPRCLEPEAYLRVLGSIVNWDSHASWRSPARLYDDTRLIRDQVFDAETTVQVDSQGLRLGARRVKTFGVKRMPEYVHLVQAAQYLGDLKTGTRGVRENLLITLNVVFPDAEHSRTGMGAKKNTATWQAMGPLSRYLPRLRRQKEDFDVLFEAIEDGDRVVKAYLSFALFCDSDEEATSASSNLLTYYRELGYRLHEDRFVCWPMFLNALPGNGDPNPTVVKNLSRYRTMATRHATQLLPVVGDWKGTGSPVMTLLSRNGQLMGIDLFDSPTNFSALVCAESGSGKSFLVNFLVSNYMSLGAEIYLIEVGRSFKNLCHILGGEHLEFTPTSDLNLNPFSAIEDYEEQSDFLMATLLAMVSPQGGVTEYQEAALRRIVRELWDGHGKSLTIDEIEQACLKQRDADGKLDQRVNDLGTQFYPFTSRGEYGRWFNGSSTVSFQSRLTVLELEELKGRRHLQQVVLVQLLAVIQRAMYLSGNHRPKLVIIDEGWDLISEGPAGVATETGTRRYRKYWGAAVLILQSINDLYRTKVGEAVWENSAHKFLLGQTPETIEGLIKSGRLALGPGAGDILKSVRTEPGLFSEIFVYTRAGAGIARLSVDRRTQLLYSTDPRDRQALATRMEAGMALEAAIDDVIATESRAPRQAG